MIATAIVAAGMLFCSGCKRDSDEGAADATASGESPGRVSSDQGDDHGREHEAGADLGHEREAGDAQENAQGTTDAGHAHDEVDIGTVTIGDMKVSLAQGHGKIAAGKEGHLVVKLPYRDDGATIVRAWIGTKDRTLSMVGKGTYAPSHDDYDVHANAPDPLPENTMWWIEIAKPDGTKVVGSAKPILE